MTKNKIIEFMSKRVANNIFYRQNKVFFLTRYYNHDDLAMRLLHFYTRNQPIKALMQFDPDYIKSNNLETDPQCFMYEEQITRFLSIEKERLIRFDDYVQKILAYLHQKRPEMFKIISSSIESFGQSMVDSYAKYTKDECPEKLKSRIAYTMFEYISPMDVFSMMTGEHEAVLNEKISLLQEICSIKDIKNYKLQNEIENLQTKKKYPPITKKENLIKLLDFCNECLQKKPDIRANKIITLFEDEKKHYGGFKTWEKFFINNASIINSLTHTEPTKKIDAIFTINDHRDKIDLLYKTIDTDFTNNI